MLWLTCMYATDTLLYKLIHQNINQSFAWQQCIHRFGVNEIHDIQ